MAESSQALQRLFLFVDRMRSSFSRWCSGRDAKELGIQEDDMILVASASSNPNAGPSNYATNSHLQGQLPPQNESEQMRLQLLGNPDLMGRIRQAFPDLANAAENNPERFRQLLPQVAEMQQNAALQRQRNIQALNDDPFNVDAQRQIEEAIRQEAVLENMEHAMEYSPESFGRVTMLYIPVEVNGTPIKAFVDSGAQATIMSPECAESCGIMRLVDKRFAGIARGVGTAKILGRVHSAQMRVSSDLYLSCSFTIMEGKGVDLLFGLDMLKRHQAIIDLEKNQLVIQGRKVNFLAEHELPESAKHEEVEVDADGNIKIPEGSAASATSTGTLGAAAAANQEAKSPGSPPKATPSFQPFSGSSNTLASGPPTSTSAQSANQQSQHPEASIQSLQDMGGISREHAIRLLDAAGGNPDVAASMMF